MKVEIDTKTARYVGLLKDCQKDHNITSCLNCPSSCRFALRVLDILLVDLEHK